MAAELWLAGDLAPLADDDYEDTQVLVRLSGDGVDDWKKRSPLWQTTTTTTKEATHTEWSLGRLR